MGRFAAGRDDRRRPPMADVPRWHARGDWFDVCKCSIPCPCTFAQPPTDDTCEGILAWHIDDGRYGEVDLSGLSVVALVILRRQHLGWREGADGVLHRRSRQRRAAAGDPGDLGWAGGGLDGHGFAGLIEKVHGMATGAHRLRGRRRLVELARRNPRHRAGRGAGAHRAEHAHRASTCRCTTHRAPRWARGRLPPGASRPPTGRTASASNGTAAASRASISRSTGADPTPPEASSHR